MKITTTVAQEVDLNLDLLAKCFAELTDDEQAQFFVKVAAWAQEHYPRPQETQWWYVGRHLSTCECSSDEGREMVRSIFSAMEYKESAVQP